VQGFISPSFHETARNERDFPKNGGDIFDAWPLSKKAANPEKEI